MSLFGARLVQLQGIDDRDYAAMAAAQGATVVTIDAPRAPILDRNGEVLARTLETRMLTADPTQTAKSAVPIATFLHDRAGLDYLTTVQALRTPDTQYVELANDLAPARAEALVDQLNDRQLAGVYTAEDTRRVYPAEDVAANVVGFVGSDGDGLSGLEYSYDEEMAGRDGRKTYEIGAQGQQLPLSDQAVVEPEEGTGLQLTIDSDLQWYAQRRLARTVKSVGGESGQAVVLDARTMDVLAMADVPTVDANNPQESSSDDYGTRSVQEAYEPGSVQKVMTFAALIDAGYVSPTTKIEVPPTYQQGADTIGDYFEHGMLRLTSTGVMALSSNIGTVRASERMPARQLYDYLRKFGLGQSTDIGIKGETAGILSTPDSWMPIQHDTITFGQGLSVTALQMTAALGAVANDGMYVTPTLVSGTVADDGTVTPTPAPERHRAVRPTTARQVARMMESVVAEDGTAPDAAIRGYNVAGKTGTAQRVDPSCGCYRGYTVSFGGFAPADDPRFVVYVAIQNPADHSAGGGSTTGPVFRDVMREALSKYGVPPTGVKTRPYPTEW